MDKKECQEILQARRVDVVDEECIELVKNCFDYAFYLEKRIEEEDPECYSLISVAKENISFFKDNANKRIELLRFELQKINADKNIREIKLLEAESNRQFYEEQKKLNEQKASSLKMELEKINADVNLKEEKISELNLKHSFLLDEKRAVNDKKVGKQAEASRLIAEENQAKIISNEAEKDYQFARDDKTARNECWSVSSPHRIESCVAKKNTKMTIAKNHFQDLNKQKERALDELNSINVQLENKAAEISNLEVALAQIGNEVKALYDKRYMVNSQLNSVDSSVRQEIMNINNINSHADELKSLSRLESITYEEKKQEISQLNSYSSELSSLLDSFNSNEAVGQIGEVREEL